MDKSVTEPSPSSPPSPKSTITPHLQAGHEPPRAARGRRLENLVAGTPGWLQLREKRLGMSTVHESIGIKSTIRDALYTRITNQRGFSEDQLAFMRAGQIDEPFIRTAYEVVSGMRFSDKDVYVPCTGKDMIDRAFIISPDGVAEDYSLLIEIKSPQFALYDPKKHHMGIPSYYLLQMQGQMAFTGVHQCDFVALCGTSQPPTCHIQRVRFCPELWEWVELKAVMFHGWVMDGICPITQEYAYDLKHLQWMIHHLVQYPHSPVDPHAVRDAFVALRKKHTETDAKRARETDNLLPHQQESLPQVKRVHCITNEENENISPTS